MFFLLICACSDSFSHRKFSGDWNDLVEFTRQSSYEILKNQNICDYPGDEATGSGIVVRFLYYNSYGAIERPVTDKNRQRDRGCFSMYDGVDADNFYPALKYSISQALLNDHRYDVIIKTEIEDMQVELAILSRFCELKNPMNIALGSDSIMIRGLGRQAIMQASLAVQYRWSKEQFWEKLCRKAGLPLDFWQHEDAVIYKAETQWLLFNFNDGKAILKRIPG